MKTPNDKPENGAEKPSLTMPGTIKKIIPRSALQEVEQAEVVVHDAAPLYQELRVENKLTNENGEEVGLKPGATVEVTIEADEKDTIKKKSAK